jgi:hypothetical protein
VALDSIPVDNQASFLSVFDSADFNQSATPKTIAAMDY